MRGYTPAGSLRRIASTPLIASTKSRQSVAARKRRLPTLLPIEAWSAAWTLTDLLDDLAEGEAGLREARLDPRDGNLERGPLALHAARELRDERARERWCGADHVGEHEDHIPRIPLGDLDETVGPLVGLLAVAPTPPIRVATRRRFSMSASRSMIGTAQSSPSVSETFDW
jgi:hypothetical protein